MSGLAFDLATVRVLVERDLRRFLRQPSRVIGAIGQPLLIWLVLGLGLASSFRVAGAGAVSYQEYFYPGVLVMVVLFASIFSTVSVIEDRQAGFLQAVMVGPGSRGALVWGKALGSTAIALIQVLLLVAMAPLGGFHFSQVNFPLLLVQLFVTSLGLTALGVGMAWWLSSVQAYHAIQMVVLVPLWMLSGAMFPLPATSNMPFFSILVRYNPITYATAGVRHALYGSHAPAALALPSPWLCMAVTVGFCAVALTFATLLCRRPTTQRGLH